MEVSVCWYVLHELSDIPIKGVTTTAADEKDPLYFIDNLIFIKVCSGLIISCMVFANKKKTDLKCSMEKFIDLCCLTF